MLTRRTTPGVLILVVALVASSAGAEPPVPTAAALERVGMLSAIRVGTDGSGNLWWWSGSNRSLQVLSPQGEWLRGATVASGLPTAVGFHAVGGVAALDRAQDVLLIPSPGDDSTLRLPRDGKASDLAWLWADRLAVAPARADHRVEIWDVGERRIVERWGEAEPVPDGPGFHRLRALRLAWDGKAERLWTLDTFTGELVVFSAGGKVELRRALAHPRLEETRAWVEEQERRTAGQTGEQEDSTLHLWTSLTLGPDGAAWVRKGCIEAPGELELVRVSADGRMETKVEDFGPCCPSGVAFWGEEMVPFRDPRHPGGGSCGWEEAFSDITIGR